MLRVRRRAWALMFVSAALLGFAFLVASPLMANPDEPAHTVKAASIYQGEWVGAETTVRQSNPEIVNGTWATVRVPRAYAQLGEIPACFAFHADVTGACSPPVSTDVSPATGTTYVGRYPPAYYLAIGWTTLVTSPWRAMWLMRALTVVACAALLATAAAALAEQQAAAAERVRWPGAAWLGLGLAMTPTVMWLAASINPNAIEIAAAIATWVVMVGVADARVPLTTRALVRAAAVGAVFVLARPLAPGFLFVIVGLVWVAHGSRDRLRELARRRAARWCAGVLAVAVLLAGTWIVAVKANDAYMGYPSTLSRGEVVQQTIENLPEQGRQMVGVFGWLDAPMPIAAVWLWGLLVAALVVAGLVRGSGRERLTTALVLAALVALPVVANLSAAQTVGTNWVGRYSLPLAVGLPVLAGVIVSRLQVPRGVAVGVTVVTVPLVLAIQGLALATLLQRYVVGNQAGFWSFLGATTGWQPPIGVHGAVALGLLALALVAVAMTLALWPRRVDGDAVTETAATATVSTR
jgi:hypothetical protein